MRTVVIGASSGLGRCVAVALAQQGEPVAMLARRKDRLDEAAAEGGPTAVPIECDVTDHAGCTAAVEQAADALGGIDAMVYTTGIGVLRRIEELDVDDWTRSFATNVIGASIATAAALPHLRASRGTAAYFSSISASLTPPWPGLAAYLTSKAALDKVIEAWGTEHPASQSATAAVARATAPPASPASGTGTSSGTWSPSGTPRATWPAP
jgi:NAD(P)-dependent dehydrogenase (short-subunit alcohol dehydrogenase family)